jgi:DNA-binding NarL/FixJ family response regulator
VAGDLVGAVRTVAAGGSLLDARSTAHVPARLRDKPAPTRSTSSPSQERRILDLIGEGLTNRQIGERMFLAEKTVKNYVSSLLSKLGLQRRTQAAVLATERRRARARAAASPARRDLVPCPAPGAQPRHAQRRAAAVT